MESLEQQQPAAVVNDFVVEQESQHMDKRIKSEDVPAVTEEVVPLKDSADIDYENMNEMRRQLQAHLDHIEKSGVPMHRQNMAVQKTYFELASKLEGEQKKIEGYVSNLASTKGFTKEHAETWIKALQANQMDPNADENVYAFVAASARYAENNARNAEANKRQYENEKKRTRELEDQLGEYKKKDEASRLVNSQQPSRLPTSFQQPAAQQQQQKVQSVNILNYGDAPESTQKIPLNNPYFNKVAASFSNDVYAKKTNYEMKPEEAKLFGTFHGFFKRAQSMNSGTNVSQWAFGKFEQYLIKSAWNELNLLFLLMQCPRSA